MLYKGECSGAYRLIKAFSWVDSHKGISLKDEVNLMKPLK